MKIAAEGIRKGILIFWDDSILLLLFNFLCFLAVLPALLFFTVTRTNFSVVTSIVNTALFLPLTFFLFALFAVLYDGRQGIHISFRKYLSYLRKTWKQALIFGSVNFLVVMLIGWDLRFFAQFETAWAGVFQLLFLSISLVWATLQLVMLPLYPRLEEPNFRTALRNSVAISGRYLIPTLVLIVCSAAFLLLTYNLQALGALFTFVLIGILAEGIIGEVVIADQEPPV